MAMSVAGYVPGGIPVPALTVMSGIAVLPAE
jgi:hypothetical protein